MTSGARAILRDLRYALPRHTGRVLRAPGAETAAAICGRLRHAGLAVTTGYFHADDAAPDDVVAANAAIAARLAGYGTSAYLSVKAPALDFDSARLRTIASAAHAAGLQVVLDSHAPKDADATLDLVDGLLGEFPGTGCVLPARWRRSLGDAERFRDSTARIRVVQGEWADPAGDGSDQVAAYLELIAALAGRSAPVAVATHRPELAERALAILCDAGTPCELEQLRGLPRRATTAIARRLDVPVRVYVPFGPGWWPYAIDKALARPYLPLWALRDRLGTRR